MVRRALMAGLLVVSGCGADRKTEVVDGSRLTRLDMTTWSIVALDPTSGDVGMAMASCVPNTFGDAVGALVPGVGVAATQAAWDLDNRDRVYAGIIEGLGAQAIVDGVTAPEVDADPSNRQYALITLDGGEVEVAGFTGAGAPDWSGIRSDAAHAVSAQGNTLVSEAVVGDALAAFLRDEGAGRDALADRLIRALEAGSAAGGDVRCNRDGITSTAATAVILVARGDDAPYATETIGMTDQSTPEAPWLAISHHTPREGPNPVVELRRRYDAWRATLDEPMTDIHTGIPR